MDVKSLWKECLGSVEGHISHQNYATWFKPIKVAASGDDFIELVVPNRFFLEWLKDHYLVLVQEMLRKAAKKDMEVFWKLADEPASVGNAPAKLMQSSGKAEAPVQQTKQLKIQPQTALSPKYTFENFVIGKANEFAHAACSSVANNLANKYNPLFISGGVGLGKTHLLQAIGHKVLASNPSAKVCYYTSERFMNEFISYISRHKMAEFRAKFRNMDVLLIDDVQFWAGKVGTQEEFFHTFNTLYEGHKQIVVTSDKYPKEVGLEDRLRSRFEWGLVADIQPPDVETKTAILRKKARGEGIKLPDEVTNWIATVSGSNIRELEGNLNRILAVASLTNQEQRGSKEPS
jgi:chromosomal replication initiator protein